MSRPDPVPPSSAETVPAPDSFESSLERLEGIVSRMEGERLPLEELLACYEQGTKLLKSCGDYLQAAEQRIELIARDENGQPRTTDFPPSAATAATAENRPADAAEPNPKSRGAAREAKISPPASASRPGSSGSSVSQPGTGSGPKSPRTNHEVSLF